MCGVIGVLGTSQASLRVLQGLQLLQHRGQDAAGILTHDESGFHFIRDLGLVERVFPKNSPEILSGNVAIGHVRYSTVAKAIAKHTDSSSAENHILSELPNVQPFFMNFPYGIGLVHNGNLTNHKALTAELRSKSRRHPFTGSDSETILNLFAESLAAQTKDEPLAFRHLCEAVASVHRQAIGSYSIVVMIADYGLVAFRDPYGLRPLICARKKEKDGKTSTLFASESTVAQFLDYSEIQDVRPGEVVVATLEGEIFRAVPKNSRSTGAEAPPARPCMFEWVYFASPQTEWEGVPVYNARIHLGRNLGRQIKGEIEAGRMQPDLIVPVPETARIAAISLSEELGIPYREVLIKNRYISRTFILDTQDKREKAVQLKLSPVESEIRGKRVLLVDDSIVRGTTSKKLIALVRACGAKEVYFVSTAPPIRYPCKYGIDFPSHEELVANGKTGPEIEDVLGADRVVYQTVDDLVSALQPIPGSGKPDVTPCLACLNREYPTESAEKTP
jgi:amidophosphoribosyltransferase